MNNSNGNIIYQYGAEEHLANENNNRKSILKIDEYQMHCQTAGLN